MILSSTDILGILGGNGVIRLSAKLSIVDGKPALSGAEGLFIYIDRFPRVDEFQATWSIYIESDGNEPDDLVLAEIRQLLPSVSVKPGLLTTVTTTDFLSENTQRPPTTKPAKAQPDLRQYEERFQGLVEDVQDQMLLVTSGRPGKDGQDGRDGLDGRDGKDLVATEVELFDLRDVERGIQMERGQVLTWDGTKWTNLYVPQTTSAGGGGGGGSSVAGVTSIIAGDGIAIDQATGDVTITNTGGTGGLSDGVEEAPQDGLFYVRSDKKWIELESALASLGYVKAGDLDGGDFTTGTSNGNSGTVDGGNFA